MDDWIIIARYSVSVACPRHAWIQYIRCWCGFSHP